MLPKQCALLVAVVALCLAINTAAQVNTPGGVRGINGIPDNVDERYVGALASSSSARGTAGPSDKRPDWAEDTADSGQLLWQSIPSFPDTEMQALATFNGILRQGSEQQAEQSGINSNRQGSTAPALVRSAADDFIEALLKTTRRAAIPGLRPLYRSAPSTDAVKQGPVQAVHMDSSTDPTLADSNDSEDDWDDDDDTGETNFDSLASTEGGSEVLPAEEQSLSTDLLSAAAAADSTTDPSTQPIADTASAVDGQVLVTQAEIIPSMQHYGQVVLSSLKMRPIPAQELLAQASAMHADAPAAVQAAAWQDNLKQALEAATALETNISVAQMHVRMTSILNLGLELAEPPVAYASAAANSVANSIKVLTGDESVLVGVSLIRLGPHAHAHNSTSTAAAGKGASAGAHVKHSSPAAEAAARSTMLAMLTLYGVGAPSNAVQIAQRMQEACPDLFVYGASLTNSSCGRTIISNCFSAVRAAQTADKGAHSADAGSAAGQAPSRTLLQDGRGVSFTSSSRLATRSSTGATTVATSITTSTNTGKLPVLDVQMRTAGAPSSSSSRAADAGGSSKVPSGQAVQQSPEMAAFMQHSEHCLRVRQQAEVTIIITQAVGVTPGQQAGPLAAQLELLSQAPAVAELLSLSGLTLAQAGKPQIIDLSAAALAAAGLGRGGTLAAASALGSEAAALGQAWGAAAGSDSSSGAAGQAAGTGSGVAAPAVIGIAVAVAVSVVAVCIAAVAIVVVKQRAKHARAAAAADGQQLPKNSKRRKSNKGKGVTSKYLPTSHPALSQNPGPSGIPPPPCVIVTALNSPCQHTPGQSPCKPGHRPAPLASAGSSALISLGSGPTGSTGTTISNLAGTPSGTYTGLLGPAVTRGDSVSSAIMAEFAEQRQHRETDDGDEEEAAGSLKTGSDGEDETQELRQWGIVRGAAVLNGASSSGRGNLSPLRTLRQQQTAHSPSAAAAPSSSNHHGAPSPSRSCSSPFHHKRQQWEVKDADSRSSSPESSPTGSHAGHQKGRRHRRGAAAAAGACAGGGEFAAAVAEGLQVFSRPLSESSLPEDLKGYASAAAAPAAAAAAAGQSAASAGGRAEGTSSSGGGGMAQRSCGAPALPTLRTLHSFNSGNPDRPGSSGPFSSGPYSSGTPVKSSPFMAYDVSVLLCAASTAPGAQVVGVSSDMASSSVADSSLQIPQWASSLNSASFGGAAGLAGSCCSGGASAAYLGAAAGQHTGSVGSRCQQQQQQQQQQGVEVHQGYPGSGGGSKGVARITPFMKPCNVPPGLE